MFYLKKMQHSESNYLFFTSNIELMAKNQREKAAKHPFVFVTCFKMLRKQCGQRFISTQIIDSSVNFLRRRDSLMSRAAASRPASHTMSHGFSQV